MTSFLHLHLLHMYPTPLLEFSGLTRLMKGRLYYVIFGKTGQWIVLCVITPSTFTRSFLHLLLMIRVDYVAIRRDVFYFLFGTYQLMVCRYRYYLLILFSLSVLKLLNYLMFQLTSKENKHYGFLVFRMPSKNLMTRTDIYGV